MNPKDDFCKHCIGPFIDDWLKKYGGHWDTCPSRVMEDERITAWDTIVRHPFFNKAFDNSNDRPLIDAMLEILDAAVQPITKEGEKNMSKLDFTSHPDEEGVKLIAYDAFSNGTIHFWEEGHRNDNNGVILTLKDVAALHKALGDHLEANKPRIPRSGAVQFSGGQIAVWRDDIAGWSVTSSNRAWGTEAELEQAFGTDWEELVVK